VGRREARWAVARKRTLSKRRSTERRFACASRTLPAVVFSAPVMSLAAWCWTGINFLVMTIELRYFLPVEERWVLVYHMSAA